MVRAEAKKQQSRSGQTIKPTRFDDGWTDDDATKFADKMVAERKSARVGGLPVMWFWLLVALVGLLVIAVSVGGAVGGSAASRATTQKTTS